MNALFQRELRIGDPAFLGGENAFKGPLDFITGANTALSTRKLRNTYSGPAIRVRRSSDNAEMDIGFTEAGDLNLTALLAHCGTADGLVPTWYDQSGAGAHFIQSTPGAQPKIVTGGVALANQFTTANSTRFLVPDSPDTNPTGDFTITGWVYFDGTTGVQALLGKFTANTGIQLYGNGASLAFQVGSGANGIYISRTITSGAWYFFVCEWDNSTNTASITVNLGTAQTTVLSGARANLVSSMGIGSTQSGTGFLGGRLDSMGLWHRKLTTNEQTWLYNSGQGRIYADLGGAGNNGSALKTDLKIWYDFDETAGDLLDKHGSNHGTSSANRPSGAVGIAKTQGTLNTQNGKPALQFDGTDDGLEGNAATLGLTKNIPGATWFNVLQSATNASTQYAFIFSANNSGGSARIGVQKSGSGVYQGIARALSADSGVFFGNTVDGNVLLSLSGSHKFTATNLHSLFRNGVAAGTGTGTTDGNTENLDSLSVFIGRRVNGNYIQGNMTEFILYPMTLSDADRQTIETNQRTYFSIS